MDLRHDIFTNIRLLCLFVLSSARLCTIKQLYVSLLAMRGHTKGGTGMGPVGMEVLNRRSNIGYVVSARGCLEAMEAVFEAAEQAKRAAARQAYGSVG